MNRIDEALAAQQHNEGIVQFDVPEEVWKNMNPQQNMMFIMHNLLDFTGTPAFHMFTGFRMQVKQNGIIMPVHVPLAIGKQPVGPRMGRI